jgi:HD-GYP domain-containing protein (c-di-GMP phosphodiesterase class II)
LFDEILPSSSYDLNKIGTFCEAHTAILTGHYDVLLMRVGSEYTRQIWNLITDYQSVTPLGPVVLIYDEITIETLNHALYYGVKDCLKFGEIATTLGFSIGLTLDRCRDLQARIAGLEKQRFEEQIDRLQKALSHELNNIFTLQDEISHSGQQLLSVLVNALEIADPYVRGHSQRVAALSKKIAGRMNQSYLMSHGLFDLSGLETAALLHDIGKLGIPDNILNKRKKLSEAEWKLIKRHPAMGADIVANIGHLCSIAPDIKSHHEWWDGTGYPQGLKAEEIPIKARILSLTDAFDAMVSPRIYRAARALPEAVAEIKKSAGTQFDPQVVEGLLWLAGDK